MGKKKQIGETLEVVGTYNRDELLYDVRSKRISETIAELVAQRAALEQLPAEV